MHSDSEIDIHMANISITNEADRVHARIGICLIVTATVAAIILAKVSTWADPIEALSTWAFALFAPITAITAVSCNRYHARWFHPLSLPLIMLLLMSLGAPVWVSLTHRKTELIYDTGHPPSTISNLSVTLTITTLVALLLILIGYLLGATGALTITQRNGTSSCEYRYPEMRRAGIILMSAAALSQLLIVALTGGTAYGANQFQYGWPSILDPGAATALLTGLALTSVAHSQLTKPTCLKDLLRGREWAVLFVYMLAVIARGGRGELIAPAVYIAWVYSARVRAIKSRWLLTGLLVALIGGSMISNYRQAGDSWPGNPYAVIQNAANAVSSPAWLTQETVIHVPSTIRYMKGSTYFAAVEGQIPGPLSRAAGVPTRTASAVFRNIIGFSDPNQGFAESYPSEAYLNFGLAGCLGAGVALGALMGWAWAKSRETATRPRDLLYSILLAGLISGFRSDALTQIKDVLYPMLILSALMGLFKVRASAQADTPQRFTETLPTLKPGMNLSQIIN
jgi:hypothetical protein